MTEAPLYDTGDLPRVRASAPVSGVIRSAPDDFQVTEELGFEPSGSGPHWFLYVENRGDSTAYVARRLARLFGVGARDVGYSGLKDRHALTRQWFSVPVGGIDPSSLPPEPGLRLLEIRRNPRKL
ncbi:MAG: tRNA pseudouridine(13) synthase TruD, partial [Pseudomonadota bacterium]